jgi:hypothetical protein
MHGDVITVEKTMPVKAGAVFDLLADASRHPEIDGSGTVRRAKSGTPGRLSLGATFGMSMKAGIGYSMVNTVVEFEDDRRIAWQARLPGAIGRFTTGRIWRYELEEVEGGTTVRESWDISEDRLRRVLKLGGLPEKTRTNMLRTLDRIEEITRAHA